MNFTKIHNFIWSIIGVLISLGFLVGVIFIGINIFNYVRYRPGGIGVEAPKESGKLKLQTVYELPLLLEGSDYFLVPVSLKKVEDETLKRRGLVKESVYSSDMGQYSSRGAIGYLFFRGPCHNVIFTHKKTGETKLLFDEKVYIDSIYFPAKKTASVPAEPFRPAFVLLTVARADTNGDKILNDKDALAGYFVNLDGTGLTQVTPDGTSMRWWRYDDGSQKLFIEISEDSNRDKKFNSADEFKTVEVDTARPGTGKAIVPRALHEKITHILAGESN